MSRREGPMVPLRGSVVQRDSQVNTGQARQLLCWLAWQCPSATTIYPTLSSHVHVLACYVVPPGIGTNEEVCG